MAPRSSRRDLLPATLEVSPAIARLLGRAEGS